MDRRSYVKQQLDREFDAQDRETSSQVDENVIQPEDCELVAHDTGDGWALSVEDTNHDSICHLKWPESWPENGCYTMSEVQRMNFNFLGWCE